MLAGGCLPGKKSIGLGGARRVPVGRSAPFTFSFNILILLINKNFVLAFAKV